MSVEQVEQQAPLTTEYRMAVPAAWQSFSTDPARFRPQVRSWLLRRTATVSRDETATQRRQVEQQMTELVEGPGARHALRLLVLSIEPAGVPVTATCLVSLVPQDLSLAEQREQWAGRTSDGAISSTVAQVGQNEAVVVVSEPSTRPDLGGATPPEVVARAARAVGAEPPAGLDDDAATRLVRDGSRGRTVEVFLPVPDQARSLLLTFSTPLVSMFDPLTELFLSMAATVQWRGEDGRWR